MDKEVNKNKFIEIYKKYIKREGSDKLLEYLIKSDFFDAPASTKFHSAYAGGLVQHTLNCYNRFKNLIELEYGKEYSNVITDESIAIIALLHDICKTDYYKVEMRNVKVNDVWEKQPYYTVEDNLPYGHGEKSVYIISGFMKLTREEAFAINWHMGGFDTRVKGGSYSIKDAFYKFPTALLFHIADMQASYLDEVENEKR